MRTGTMIAVMAALALAAPAWGQAAKVEVRTQGTARLENVPAIPAEVSAEVQRYQNYRAAGFQDWLGDGSMLITTRFGATSQLHRVTQPGGARTQLTFGQEPIADAVALPGDRFIYARDTGGDEWYQAFARGVGSPVAVQLTEPGTRNQRPVVSKDGKLIAWSQSRKGTAENRIFVGNPADPKSARVAFTSEGSMFVSDIAPDGGSLLLSRNISNRASELYRLDLKSGERVRIGRTAEPVRLDDAKYTPDGRSVIATTDEGSDFRQLVEIDLRTERKVPLTPGLKWDVEGFELSPDGRVLAYVVNEDGFSRVVVQDRVTRRALPQPELPRGVVTGLGFSPDGRSLAVGMSTARSPGDVWVADVASAKVTRWTNSELGELAEADFVEPELVRFKSFDGLTVSALVYRPKDAKGPTSVIMDIHGGPEAQTRPNFNPGAQYFVKTLGATVILPNVRGSDGYGKRYLNLDNAEKREDSVRDIGALLDWVKTQPGLDAGRVAVYGQSYGGYMSAAVMTFYSDRLVGGVKRYGITDFRTFLERTEAYRRDNRRAEYGDERNPEMAKVFARIAPMANIGKVTKPMLIMQGANDPRVPEAESAQWVAALRGRGIETWYVLFSDEGHGFQKKPNNDLRREVETVFLQKVFGQGQVGGGSVASR